MPARDPHFRSVHASAMSHASWARTADPAARLRNAWSARDKYIAEAYGISPDLPSAEFERRMKSARSAYFRALAQKSAKARRRPSTEQAA